MSKWLVSVSIAMTLAAGGVQAAGDAEGAVKDEPVHQRRKRMKIQPEIVVDVSHVRIEIEIDRVEADASVDVRGNCCGEFPAKSQRSGLSCDCQSP